MQPYCGLHTVNSCLWDTYPILVQRTLEGMKLMSITHVDFHRRKHYLPPQWLSQIRGEGMVDSFHISLRNEGHTHIWLSLVNNFSF